MLKRIFIAALLLGGAFGAVSVIAVQPAIACGAHHTS